MSLPSTSELITQIRLRTINITQIEGLTVLLIPII